MIGPDSIVPIQKELTRFFWHERPKSNVGDRRESEGHVELEIRSDKQVHQSFEEVRGTGE